MTLSTPVFSAVSSTPPSRRRSIGAVAAGLLSIFAVTTATDLAMHALGIFSAHGSSLSNCAFLLALTYRVFYDVAGSYLTARLAPHRPFAHALVLGSIGLVLTLAGAIAMRGAGPIWYPLSLAASALPSAWFGARLSARRSQGIQSV